MAELSLDWAGRWPDFSPEEIYSPYALSYLRHILCPHSMDALQTFRTRLNKPVLVNFGDFALRGVRSIKENASIRGAAPESMHQFGRAFDITVPGMTVEQLFAAATDCGLWNGIGLYNTWVHVDTRIGKLATWDLSS